MKPLSARTVADQWLQAFAASVSEDNLSKYVARDRNFLWHIFSWELVPCLKEDAARKAFDALEYDRAIRFHFGYYRNGTFSITDISFTGKLCSADLDDSEDIYITAPDFSWTYVHTHESYCGPYFCRREG